jgi:hypothetical protein
LPKQSPKAPTRKRRPISPASKKGQPAERAEALLAGTDWLSPLFRALSQRLRPRQIAGAGSSSADDFPAAQPAIARACLRQADGMFSGRRRSAGGRLAGCRLF